MVIPGPNRMIGEPVMSAPQRKAYTERVLRERGIPINPFLPEGPDRHAIHPQLPASVAARCLVLLALLNVVHDAKRAPIARWLKEYRLWDAASPSEQIFFKAPLSGRSVRYELSWQAEALWVLLWALEMLPALAWPVELCRLDDPALVGQLPRPGHAPDEFLHLARLRDTDELLNELDLTYRLHWAVRDAALKGLASPCGLNPDVVSERHYALNWLMDSRKPWDDVATDT